MLSSYQRRVSFDSLGQNRAFEADNPLHIPPQYENYALPPNSEGTNKRSSRQLDLNFGFETSRKTDVLDIFNSFNEIGNKSPYYNGSLAPRKKKKIPKLPPPPKKSILKNNSAIDDADPLSSKPRTVSGPKYRKKSIIDMTTEELLAMDQQFRTGVQLDKLKFDGDGYLPFSGSTTEAHTLRKTGGFGDPKKIKNIDKAVGSMINKKTNKDITSFNSYFVSFKHNDMDNYLKEHLQIKDEDTVKSDTKKTKMHVDSSKIIPESLRNVMVYISGRKHTWNAIDFSIEKYLQHGDQLIIVSHVPTRGGHSYETAVVDEEEEDDEICERTKEAIQNLTFYIFKMIEMLKKQDLKISIKLEFIKNQSVKTVLKDSINFYKPQVMLISSLLSNMNLTFAKRYTRLPLYVMKNLNIPTLIIPTLLIVKDTEDTTDIDQKPPLINQSTYIDRLDLLIDSIDQTKDFDPSSRIVQSRPSISYSTSSRSDSIGLLSTGEQLKAFDGTSSHLMPSSPKIKFIDNLQAPKSSSNHVGHSSSSSRRNSNNHGSIYKVKSLLDDDYDIPKVVRSKSDSTSPITPSMSGDEINRQKSSQSVVSSSSTKSKKSGLFGLFKKKK